MSRLRLNSPLLSIPDERRIKLYLGTTGSGKTTLMHKHLMEERRVFLFDMMSAVQFERWGVLCDNVSDGVQLAARCRDKGLPFHIRFQFRSEAKFDWICSLCVKQPHGLQAFEDVCIAVDELSFFTNPHYIPPSLEDVIRLGRHTQVRFSATTQRAVDMHTLIRSQSKEQYLFQMHEPADIDYYNKRLSREDMRRVINLTTGEYVLWTPGIGGRNDARLRSFSKGNRDEDRFGYDSNDGGTESDDPESGTGQLRESEVDETVD